eukprot:1707787-Pleurochrysis_carterae.AAC.1
MPWRPEGTPPTHECERCRRPVHTAIACPGDVVMLEEGKYYCNRKCACVGTTAAAAANKAAKAMKLESVRSSRQNWFSAKACCRSRHCCRSSLICCASRPRS